MITNLAVPSAGPDTIQGGAGQDILEGLAGDDALWGGAGDDLLYGGDDNDFLYGEVGDDILDGGDGNDHLDGGVGRDDLIGGAGNDTYYIRDVDASITEFTSSAGGVDTALIFIPTFRLQESAGVDVVQVADGVSFGVSLTGNSFANTLIGGAADDKLNGMDGGDHLLGGAGNDTIDGGSADDTLDGGSGDDVYFVDSTRDMIHDSDGIDLIIASTSYSIASSNIEKLVAKGGRGLTFTGNTLSNILEGSPFDDILIGGDGDDTLNGWGGNDRLEGGRGNDEYWLDSLFDTIVDVSGVDTIRTTVSYALGVGIERLIAAGTGAYNLEGNTLDNTLVGGSAGDRLKGLAGNDALEGGAGADEISGGLGRDVLVGGAGRDAFVFDSAIRKRKNQNYDKILDLNVKDDSIWLENAIFTKLGRKGSPTKPATLKKDFFKVGSHASDQDDYIIYNKSKKTIYYDPDGTGSGAAIKIATASQKVKLTYKDFLVI